MKTTTSGRYVTFIVKIKRMDIAMQTEHLYAINTITVIIATRNVNQPVIENAIRKEHSIVK